VLEHHVTSSTVQQGAHLFLFRAIAEHQEPGLQLSTASQYIFIPVQNFSNHQKHLQNRTTAPKKVFPWSSTFSMLTECAAHSIPGTIEYRTWHAWSHSTSQQRRAQHNRFSFLSFYIMVIACIKACEHGAGRQAKNTRRLSYRHGQARAKHGVSGIKAMAKAGMANMAWFREIRKPYKDRFPSEAASG